MGEQVFGETMTNLGDAVPREEVSRLQGVANAAFEKLNSTVRLGLLKTGRGLYFIRIRDGGRSRSSYRLPVAEARKVLKRELNLSWKGSELMAARAAIELYKSRSGNGHLDMPKAAESDQRRGRRPDSVVSTERASSRSRTSASGARSIVRGTSHPSRRPAVPVKKHERKLEFFNAAPIAGVKNAAPLVALTKEQRAILVWLRRDPAHGLDAQAINGLHAATVLGQTASALDFPPAELETITTKHLDSIIAQGLCSRVGRPRIGPTTRQVHVEIIMNQDRADDIDRLLAKGDASSLRLSRAVARNGKDKVLPDAPTMPTMFGNLAVTRDQARAIAWLSAEGCGLWLKAQSRPLVPLVDFYLATVGPDDIPPSAMRALKSAGVVQLVIHRDRAVARGVYILDPSVRDSAIAFTREIGLPTESRDEDGIAPESVVEPVERVDTLVIPMELVPVAPGEEYYPQGFSPDVTSDPSLFVAPVIVPSPGRVPIPDGIMEPKLAANRFSDVALKLLAWLVVDGHLFGMKRHPAVRGDVSTVEVRMLVEREGVLLDGEKVYHRRLDNWDLAPDVLARFPLATVTALMRAVGMYKPRGSAILTDVMGRGSVSIRLRPNWRQRVYHLLMYTGMLPEGMELGWEPAPVVAAVTPVVETVEVRAVDKSTYREIETPIVVPEKVPEIPAGQSYQGPLVWMPPTGSMKFDSCSTEDNYCALCARDELDQAFFLSPADPSTFNTPSASLWPENALRGPWPFCTTCAARMMGVFGFPRTSAELVRMIAAGESGGSRAFLLDRRDVATIQVFAFSGDDATIALTLPMTPDEPLREALIARGFNEVQTRSQDGRARWTKADGANQNDIDWLTSELNVSYSLTGGAVLDLRKESTVTIAGAIARMRERRTAMLGMTRLSFIGRDYIPLVSFPPVADLGAMVSLLVSASTPDGDAAEYLQTIMRHESELRSAMEKVSEKLTVQALTASRGSTAYRNPVEIEVPGFEKVRQVAAQRREEEKREERERDQRSFVEPEVDENRTPQNADPVPVIPATEIVPEIVVEPETTQVPDEPEDVPPPSIRTRTSPAPPAEEGEDEPDVVSPPSPQAEPAVSPEDYRAFWMRPTSGLSTERLIIGHEAEIVTSGLRLVARYAVISLDDLVASHDPRTWNEDPRYPAQCQQRDYKVDVGERGKVELYASKLDLPFLLTDTPSPLDGPATVVMVGDLGIVLGGNGRSMSLMIASDEEFARYWTALRRRAPYFGIAGLDRIKGRPVLVRLVNVDLHDCARLSNTLNTGLTQAVDSVQMAISQQRQLTDRDIWEIAEAMENASTEGTLKAAMDIKSFNNAIILRFRSAGLITQENASLWMNEKTEMLNQNGRKSLEAILLSRVLPDRKYQNLVRSYTDIALRNIPALLGAESLGPEWSLTPELLQVIRYEYARRDTGLRREEFLNQEVNSEAWNDPLMERTPLLWETMDFGAVTASKILRKYWASAINQTKGDDMFGTVAQTPLAVLDHLVKTARDKGSQHTLMDGVAGISCPLCDRIGELCDCLTVAPMDWPPDPPSEQPEPVIPSLDDGSSPEDEGGEGEEKDREGGRKKDGERTRTLYGGYGVSGMSVEPAFYFTDRSDDHLGAERMGVDIEQHVPIDWVSKTLDLDAPAPKRAISALLEVLRSHDLDNEARSIQRIVRRVEKGEVVNWTNAAGDPMTTEGDASIALFPLLQRPRTAQLLRSAGSTAARDLAAALFERGYSGVRYEIDSGLFEPVSAYLMFTRNPRETSWDQPPVTIIRADALREGDIIVSAQGLRWQVWSVTPEDKLLRITFVDPDTDDSTWTPPLLKPGTSFQLIRTAGNPDVESLSDPEWVGTIPPEQASLTWVVPPVPDVAPAILQQNRLDTPIPVPSAPGVQMTGPTPPGASRATGEPVIGGAATPGAPSGAQGGEGSGGEGEKKDGEGEQTPSTALTPEQQAEIITSAIAPDGTLVTWSGEEDDCDPPEEIAPAISLADITVSTVPRRRLTQQMREFLGALPKRFLMFVHGAPGGGKSTLALKLLKEFSNEDSRDGKFELIVNSEQPSSSGAMRDRALRAGLSKHDVYVVDTKSFDTIKHYLDTGKYAICVIDSISALDAVNENDRDLRLRDLYAKYPKVSFVVIAHEDKTGRYYKGKADLAHYTETVIRVHQGVAETRKNHWGPTPKSMKVMEWATA